MKKLFYITIETQDCDPSIGFYLADNIDDVLKDVQSNYCSKGEFITKRNRFNTEITIFNTKYECCAKRETKSINIQENDYTEL